jgi:sulfonate transport system substrate-binding protein
VGAAGLAVPILAACGSGSSSSASSSSSTTGAAASAAPVATSTKDRKKVRLTYSATTLAKSRPTFTDRLAQQGIDVEWVGPFPNHAPTLQAVVGGTADFSFGGSSTPADQAIISGGNLTYVAIGVSTPRSTSIIVRPDGGIGSVPDLAGKKVAVNKAGLGEFLLVAALEKYKVPKGDVDVIYLNPPEAGPAFAADQVDAWSIWQGPLEQAEVAQEAKAIFVDGQELDRQIDFVTYLVRDDYAKKEPDTIRAVIAAYKAEADWANQNLAEAQNIANQVAKYPQAVVDRIVSKGVTTQWRLIDDGAIADLQWGADWLTERQVLSDHIDIAKHVVKL